MNQSYRFCPVTENNYWGSDKGISEQKDFESMIPEPWKRILETYQTVNGEEFQMHLGDNYEFRKIENGAESRAMKLYWDWDTDEPRWRLLVGREYELKDNRIARVIKTDTYEFQELAEARDKVLKLMHELE